METKILDIEGMTCTSCARNIEETTKKVSGVKDASVNFATEKLIVTYDSNTVSLLDIEERISKIGFEAFEEGTKEKISEEDEIAALKKRVLQSMAFAIPLFLISMVPMLLSAIGVPMPAIFDHMAYPKQHAILQLLLTTPIVIIGWKFFTVGFKSLINGAPNMDSLIAIGSGAAYIYGLYGVYYIFRYNHHFDLYFESAGIILTLITLGKYLEVVSKGKTSEAIKKLMGLAPKTAIIIVNGIEKEVSIDDVKEGDILLVKPGERMPVDGIVTSGFTSVDEAMITGESIPVEKKLGDNIISATINKNGLIQYEATKVGKNTTLSQIIKLVEDAQNSKAPIAKMADIISGYFVPVVIILALASGIGWFIYTKDVSFSLKIFISVLVIACPCALGLATPTAIMVGTGKGAENGILIKSGESLETAHKLDTIVLDKTGTITEGKPKVTDIISFDKDIDKEMLLKIAASCEKGSEHPLGEAIVNAFEEKNESFFEIEHFNSITGQGIEAVVNNMNILIGNKKLMDENNILAEKEEIDNLADHGKTPMFIAINNELKGIIAVADTLKKTSAQVVSAFKKMGIEVIMITGDNKKTAQAIGREVGIDNVLAEVLPEDKAFEVKKLQDKGKIVGMVGDGINDAPALAQSNIGIAIGSGTDVAMESADIVLMRNDLIGVVTAIELSKRTMKTIKQNLFWALLYNTLGIPVAMGILYIFGGPLLNPIIAALAMSFSSVSVLLNTLRLKKFNMEGVI